MSIDRKEDSILNIFYTPFVEDLMDVEYEILQGLDQGFREDV